MELEVPTTLSCDAGQTAVSAAVQHARQLSARINVAVCGAPRLLVAFLRMPLSFPQSIERVSNPNGILTYKPLPRCPACYAPVKGVSISEARKALSLLTLRFKATERCVLLTCYRCRQLYRGQFLPEARVTVSYGSRVRTARGRLNRPILLVARTAAFLGYFFGLEARDVPMLEAERYKHGVHPRGKLSRQSKASNLMITRLQRYAHDVWGFATDVGTPFTNNLAEQAVRIPKVKQKISGGFPMLEAVKTSYAPSAPALLPSTSKALASSRCLPGFSGTCASASVE